MLGKEKAKQIIWDDFIKIAVFYEVSLGIPREHIKEKLKKVETFSEIMIFVCDFRKQYPKYAKKYLYKNK